MTDTLNAPFINSALGKLSLEQKVRLLTGASLWTLQDEPSIGLRSIVVSDGPTGVRGDTLDERNPSASLPSASCVSASWDLGRVARLGRLIAAEARSKGVDVVLGPTVNLHRSPRGGRHFEAFSEDPFLTGEIGAAYVASVQAQGVATTPKHYVANDSETDRFSVNVEVDERALREVYLAPFERLVAEGAWLVMSSYNAVNGTTMTANSLLRHPLKDEWGFDGVVVSDWTAVRDTDESARSGQDLAMPGPDGVWGDALVNSVRAGRVPEAAIDEKVARLLLLASRVGALDEHPAHQSEPWTDDDIAALLREAAADGMVLARNDGILPLAPHSGLRIGVVGQHAVHPRAQGGGSASVFPPYVRTPLEGLRASYGTSSVAYAPGLPPVDELNCFSRSEITDPITGDPGVHVRYLQADGTAFDSEVFPSGRLAWVGDPRLLQAAQIEIRTRFTTTRDGAHNLGFSGLGLLQFEIDGEVVSADPVMPPTDGDGVNAFLSPPNRTFRRELVTGQQVELRLVFTPYFPEGFPFAMLMLGEKGIFDDPHAELERAVALAASSDIAIVVVGTTEAIESEGVDRGSLTLPEGQDDLVRRVLEANPRTIVIVNSGAPVVMPWLDEVAAVLLTWFPGQEFGDALADVLSGEREPGGRMPTTWAAREEDVPVWSVEPQDGALSYSEGIHVGYRAWLRQQANGGAAPALSFGSGLGYTTWSVGASTIRAERNSVFVDLEVTNTGERAGKQVIQAYLAGPVDSTIERPECWLAGFAVVRANTGETVTATIEISRRAFEHWDPSRRAWSTESGEFCLRIASSVEDAGQEVAVAAHLLE